MRRFYKIKPMGKIVVFSCMFAALCLMAGVDQGAAKSGKADAFMSSDRTQTSQTTTTSRHVSKPGCQYYGTVLRVGEDEIVVDDRLVKLSKNVVYHVSGGGLFSKEIKKGAFIGFNLNDKKQITDIWIFKNK